MVFLCCIVSINVLYCYAIPYRFYYFCYVKIQVWYLNCNKFQYFLMSQYFNVKKCDKQEKNYVWFFYDCVCYCIVVLLDSMNWHSDRKLIYLFIFYFINPVALMFLHIFLKYILERNANFLWKLQVKNQTQSKQLKFWSWVLPFIC